MNKKKKKKHPTRRLVHDTILLKIYYRPSKDMISSPYLRMCVNSRRGVRITRDPRRYKIILQQTITQSHRVH